MEARGSRWAGRFINVTFILGGIAWAILGLLVLGNILAGLTPPNYALGPASSRIVAQGGPGTWFVMGILSYLLVGVAGPGLTALFYQHLEVTLATPLKGWKNIAAWIHLGVGCGAAAAGSLVMTYAGFLAGSAYLATNVGGGGHDVAYIHTNFLGPATQPIGALMGVALLGYLAGGIALTLGWFEARKRGPA
jgi:hypothetical protein